jgi:hypothetical protein
MTDTDTAPVDGERYLSAALDAARRCGVRTWEFRQPTEYTGVADRRRGHTVTAVSFPPERHIVCPEPRDEHWLLSWLHECGHVMYQHRVRNYWAEYQVERFALEEFERLGFVPSAELLWRVASYVGELLCDAIATAERRGRAVNMTRYDEVFQWYEEITLRIRQLPPAKGKKGGAK